MADASDSKSDVGDYVWVQVPSPALRKMKIEYMDSHVLYFFAIGNVYYIKRFTGMYIRVRRNM